jgi:hypothetical protein
MKTRRWNGWTSTVLEGFRELLEKYPPVAVIHLKPPRRKVRKSVEYRPGYLRVETKWDPTPNPLERGRPCEQTLNKIDRAIRDYARKFGYKGAWILFLEDSRWVGFHLHVCFTCRLPRAMIEALARTWNRLISVTNNKQQGFKYELVKDTGKMISYLGKSFDGDGYIAKETFERWGPQGNVFPYRTGGMRNSHPEKDFSRPEAPQNVKIAPPVRASEKRVFGLLEADCSQINRPEIQPGPEHVYNSNEQQRTNSKTPLFPNGHSSKSPCLSQLPPYRIGVRIAPLYGPADVLIAPPLDWATAHVLELAKHWPIESVTDCGPAWPQDSVEINFLVPASDIQTFEQKAAVSFAKVFRP